MISHESWHSQFTPKKWFRLLSVLQLFFEILVAYNWKVKFHSWHDVLLWNERTYFKLHALSWVDAVNNWVKKKRNLIAGMIIIKLSLSGPNFNCCAFRRNSNSRRGSLTSTEQALLIKVDVDVTWERLKVNVYAWVENDINYCHLSETKNRNCVHISVWGQWIDCETHPEMPVKHAKSYELFSWVKRLQWTWQVNYTENKTSI